MDYLEELPGRFVLAAIALFSATSVHAALHRDAVRRDSNLQDIVQPMSPPSEPWAFVNASRGGRSSSEAQISALVMPNPDPSGSGTITYSSAADNPDLYPELPRLAAALGNDPVRIYEWVRNNIQTEFYYGCTRGAYVTFLERAGNDIDQCALLGALFRAAGLGGNDLRYRIDYVTVPQSVVGANATGAFEWLGVDNQDGVLSMLRNYSPSATGSLGSTTYRFICMSVSLNFPGRGLVRFYPSIKPLVAVRPIDLDVLSGYSFANAQAAAGASTGGAASPALNSAGLRAYLSGLSVAVSDAMHSSQLHDVSGAELSKVSSIAQELVTLTAPDAPIYPSSVVQNESSPTGELNGIPTSFVPRIMLRVGSRTEWFESASVMAKSLSIEFDINGVATIRINGTQAGAAEASGGSASVVEIEYGHEYPLAYTSGVSSFSSKIATVPRQNTAVFVYSTGSAAGRLEKVVQDLAEKEAASASSVVAEDRLRIIGLRYLAQNWEVGQLTARAMNSEKMVYCLGALVFIKAGTPALDLGLNKGMYYSRTSNANASAGAVSGSEIIMGALEGTAIEQMSGARSYGAPTLLEHAMTIGRDAYLLDASNWNTYVGTLQNYSAAEIQYIQSAITAGSGFKALVLRDGAIGLGSQSFFAMLQITTWGGLGSRLNTLFGSGTPDPLGSREVNEKVQKGTKSADSQKQATSSDPVDLTTGAFLKSDIDLTLGDPEPNGLLLERSYNSANRLVDPTGLGRGWTHNYDMRIAVHSASTFSATRSTMDEVIPLIVAARFVKDVTSQESSARVWLMASIAGSWAADQLLESRASVAMGPRSLTFVRRPDGKYMSPPNVQAELIRQSSGAHELQFRNGNRITFRASDGKFVSIKDPYNNQLSATYNTDGTLATVTDSYLRYLSFSYSSGRLYSVADSTGRSVSYGRDASQNFTFTDVEGKSRTIEWDAEFLVTRVRDGRGRIVVENDYDAGKRVYRQRTFGDGARTSYIQIVPGVGGEKDPLGYVTWTYFDERGRKRFFVDQVGHLSTWNYDGVDRLVLFRAPDGGERSFEYDVNDFMTSETNPEGNTRLVEPDEHSRPWKVGNYEGRQTIYTYTDGHKIETIEAPGGIVDSFEYDSRGRLWRSFPAKYENGEYDEYSYDSFGGIDKITYPLNGPDEYTVSARGDLLDITDRRGVKTSYTYNARRQKTGVIFWEGTVPRASSIVYDDAGDIDYEVDASGRKTDLEHDALGNLTEIRKGPIGGQVVLQTNSFTDPRTLLEAKTNALGQVTTYTYTPNQLLETVEDPLHRVTTFSYDGSNRLMTRMTPLGLAASPDYKTTTIWNQNGLKDSEEDAAGNLVDYNYDKDGRMTSLANRLNRSFAWVYDDEQRKVTSSTPLLKATTSVRNTRGLLASIARPSDQVSAPSVTFDIYDEEGRLKQRTDGVGVATYTYWENGLLKNVTENGKTTYREYDALNRLSRYDDGEGNSLSYQYHPSGELWKLTYPGNKVVTYEYDDFGRLWHVIDWATRTTTYTYDDAARLKRISLPNQTSRDFIYDAAGQLRFVTDVDDGGAILLFQQINYDDDGQIRSLFRAPAPGMSSETDSFDHFRYDNDNRLEHWTPAGGTELTVVQDANGNMTYGPQPDGILGSYQYDARDRLLGVAGASYRYNPDGLRVQITGAGASTFVVDPNNEMSRTLVRSKGGVTTYYIYGEGLLYEETDGAIKCYHSDQVGSTLAITDEAGDVTDRWSYTIFGKVAERTGSTDTPYQFNGAFGVCTDECGLYYMRARYYNPRIMRFLNADPIGFDGGLNWYAAFGNNPINAIDPLGMKDSKVYDGDMLERFVVKAYRLPAAILSFSTQFDAAVDHLLQQNLHPATYLAVNRAVEVTLLVGPFLVPEMLFGRIGAAESGASSALNGARLRTQLAAEEIAGGHAYGKHVIKQGEFPGITSPKQFAGEIERIMTNPSEMRHLSGGRTAYWDNATNTVVIRNPAAADGGTALRPTAGKSYFDNLK